MLDSAIEELAHAEFGHVFLPLFLAILSHAAMLSRVVAHAMSHALSHTTLLSNYNLKNLTIWSLEVQPKIRNFLWHACNDIPTPYQAF